jgi:hypothetical protein
MGFHASNTDGAPAPAAGGDDTLMSGWPEAEGPAGKSCDSALLRSGGKHRSNMTRAGSVEKGEWNIALFCCTVRVCALLVRLQNFMHELGKGHAAFQPMVEPAKEMEDLHKARARETGLGGTGCG